MKYEKFEEASDILGNLTSFKAQKDITSALREIDFSEMKN